MAFDPINNHVEQAKERLIQQYKGKTRIEGLIEAAVAGKQDLEDTATQLNTLRSVDTATGAQLDGIGEIVGVEREGGQSDADYRVRIKAQIGINLSQGQPERIISTFQVLKEAELVLLQQLQPAAIGISSEATFVDQEEVDEILEILESISPAGVRVDFIGIFDADEPFAFQGSISGLGFGSTTDPLLGGLFATLVLRDGEFAFAGDDLTAEGLGTTLDPLVGGQIQSL